METDSPKHSYEDIIQLLLSGKPYEQIINSAYFYGRKFYINEDVLIPRPETQEIIDIFLSKLSSLDISPSTKIKIIDVGTGSGCIICTLYDKLSVEYPNAQFLATDISPEALEVAKVNIGKREIKLVQTDMIKGIEVDKDTIIISNPPYIPTKIYEGLDQSVLDHEPKIALESGEDGLEHMDKLLEVKEFKFMLVELMPEVIEQLQKETEIKDRSKVLKDFRGKDRFVLLG